MARKIGPVMLSARSSNLLQELSDLDPAQIQFLAQQALRAQQQQQQALVQGVVATPSLPVVGPSTPARQVPRRPASTPSTPARGGGVNFLAASQQEPLQMSKEEVTETPSSDLAESTGRGSVFFVSAFITVIVWLLWCVPSVLLLPYYAASC